MKFKNRIEAGQLLAQALKKYQHDDIVVYALPRGGVIVAAEIAHCLGAPLDLVIVRKIGHPKAPEYAIAAVAEDGRLIASEHELTSIEPLWLQNEVELQRKEAKRRRETYLPKDAHVSPKDKIAILVDDGIATGLSMRAAIAELKLRHPKKIIVAIPIAPSSMIDVIKKEADDVIALEAPQDFHYLGSVSAYYDSFPQLEDREVIDTLQKCVSASR